MKTLIPIALLGIFATNVGAETLHTTTTQQVFSIPVNAYAGSAPVQVYSICIPLTAGSIADVTAQTEVTNNSPYNVGIGYDIQVWNYHVDQYGTSTYLGQYPLSRPVMGPDLTNFMHHLPIYIGGKEVMYPVVASSGLVETVRCYTLKLWAASTMVMPNIVIESGYGQLTVDIRP